MNAKEACELSARPEAERVFDMICRRITDATLTGSYYTIIPLDDLPWNKPARDALESMVELEGFRIECVYDEPRSRHPKMDAWKITWDHAKPFEGKDD